MLAKELYKEDAFNLAMPKKAWTDIITTVHDKNSYCRKLLYQIYHNEDEFVERRFYELAFALYARFFQEQLEPQLLAEYFAALQEIVTEYAVLEHTPEIQTVINLGLQLKSFQNYTEDNFQLTNILLQINYHVTLWQNKNHICKYCGHKLDLLTQPVKNQ